MPKNQSVGQGDGQREPKRRKVSFNEEKNSVQKIPARSQPRRAPPADDDFDMFGGEDGAEDGGKPRAGVDHSVKDIQHQPSDDMGALTNVQEDEHWEKEYVEGDNMERFNKSDGDDLEPFHLDDELKTGYFDRKTGGYVEHRRGKRKLGFEEEGDENDDDEYWLEKADKEEDVHTIKSKQIDAILLKSLEKKTSGKQNEGKGEEKGEESSTSSQSSMSLYKSALDLLDDGETVLQALRRYRPPKRRGNKKKAEKEQEPRTEEETAENKRKFDQLTEIADELMMRGMRDPYNEKKEAIAKRISGILGDTSETEVDEAQDNLWEYKTSLTDSNIIGPFTIDQMRSWWRQGYFQGESHAFLRKAGTNNFLHSEDESMQKMLSAE